MPCALLYTSFGWFVAILVDLNHGCWCLSVLCIAVQGPTDRLFNVCVGRDCNPGDQDAHSFYSSSNRNQPRFLKRKITAKICFCPRPYAKIGSTKKTTKNIKLCPFLPSLDAAAILCLLLIQNTQCKNQGSAKLYKLHGSAQCNNNLNKALVYNRRCKNISIKMRQYSAIGVEMCMQCALLC